VESLRSNDNAWFRLSWLDIIPARNGSDLTWVSIANLSHAPVYTPYIGDKDSVRIEIPDDLNLPVLHPIAVAVGQRLAFYESLGIEDCKTSLVVDAIVRRHRKGGNAKIRNIVTHFEILFLSDKPDPRYLGRINAVSAEPVNRSPGHLYLRSDRPLSTEKLLQNTTESKKNAWLLPSTFPAIFSQVISSRWQTLGTMAHGLF